MKKVLVVMNAKEVRLGGGIINVILNYKNGFKGSKDYRFDYAINLSANSGIEQMLIDGGSEFFQLPNKSKSFGTYVLQLIKICRTGNYDVIHVHGSSSTMSLELLCAKIANIPNRVAHSHNSRCQHPILNKILNPFLMKLSTNRVACSYLAGEWLFGAANFEVVHNAFDIDKFAYDCQMQINEKNLQGINQDCLSFAMVGNLVDQKNPEFALMMLNEISQRVNFKMFFIGDGPLKNKLLKMVEEMKLEKQVEFLGVCDDIQNKLQMIDVFLMPSIYEGLGISALEAQASGCICLLSENIPEETRFSQYTKYLSISDCGEWIEAIDEICSNDLLSVSSRQQRSLDARIELKKKYSIENAIKQLERIYNE